MIIARTEGFCPSRRQSTIYGLAAEEITRAVGFPPEVDDPGRVDHLWNFTVTVEQPDMGMVAIRCSIWSIKGSDRHSVWSAYGDPAVFGVMFPTAKVD